MIACVEKKIRSCNGCCCDASFAGFDVSTPCGKFVCRQSNACSDFNADRTALSGTVILLREMLHQLKGLLNYCT